MRDVLAIQVGFETGPSLKSDGFILRVASRTAQL